MKVSFFMKQATIICMSMIAMLSIACPSSQKSDSVDLDVKTHTISADLEKVIEFYDAQIKISSNSFKENVDLNISTIDANDLPEAIMPMSRAIRIKMNKYQRMVKGQHVKVTVPINNEILKGTTIYAMMRAVGETHDSHIHASKENDSWSPILGLVDRESKIFTAEMVLSHESIDIIVVASSSMLVGESDVGIVIAGKNARHVVSKSSPVDESITWLVACDFTLASAGNELCESEVLSNLATMLSEQETALMAKGFRSPIMKKYTRAQAMEIFDAVQFKGPGPFSVAIIDDVACKRDRVNACYSSDKNIIYFYQSSFNKTPEELQQIVVHELMHAIQFAYDIDSNDRTVWFVESTAEAMARQMIGLDGFSNNRSWDKPLGSMKHDADYVRLDEYKTSYFISMLGQGYENYMPLLFGHMIGHSDPYASFINAWENVSGIPWIDSYAQVHQSLILNGKNADHEDLVVVSDLDNKQYPVRTMSVKRLHVQLDEVKWTDDGFQFLECITIDNNHSSQLPIAAISHGEIFIVEPGNSFAADDLLVKILLLNGISAGNDDTLIADFTAHKVPCPGIENPDPAPDPDPEPVAMPYWTGVWADRSAPGAVNDLYPVFSIDANEQDGWLILPEQDDLIFPFNTVRRSEDRWVLISNLFDDIILTVEWKDNHFEGFYSYSNGTRRYPNEGKLHFSKEADSRPPEWGIEVK